VDINYGQVAVVLAPGRKRENLVALLASIFPVEKIQIIECTREGLKDLSTSGVGLIFVDYSVAREGLVKMLEEFRRRNPQCRVILLLAHPHEKGLDAEIHADGILYDGFSTRTLMNMLDQAARSS
jgi:DNA-binding NarL/FixJ family response regulator